MRDIAISGFLLILNTGFAAYNTIAGNGLLATVNLIAAGLATIMLAMDITRMLFSR